MVGLLIISGLLSSGPHSSSTSRNETTYSPPDSSVPDTAARQPTVERSEERRSFAVLTTASDGRAWNAAAERDKLALCRGLAASSAKGKSAGFYQDALDALYNTTDDSILRITISGAVRTIDAASSAPP
jgi:hypothetical protein